MHSPDTEPGPQPPPFTPGLGRLDKTWGLILGLGASIRLPSISVFGRLNNGPSSKDVHVLILKAREYFTFYDKRGLEYKVTLRILTWGEDLRSSQWAQYNPKQM